MALKSDSALVLLGRIIWVMFGPLLLLAIAFFILTRPGWRIGINIAYFVTLVAVVLGRWIEHLGGDPKTSTGERSTPADLHRFILFTLAGGAALWLVANLIANYVVGRA
jgi:hypothetical protein